MSGQNSRRHAPLSRNSARSILRLHPIAACILAAFANFAWAEDTTLPEIQVQESPESATGPVIGYRATRSATFTKTDEPLREVPASVTVVPGQLMKDQAMQSLSDVFRYVPGVLTHQGEGNRDQIILRGNSTTADFYVNGVRDDAQIFRDLYNLERVEVLKGPGGMIFGRGGAGGVVNRVTKRPVFGEVGEANLTVGSWEQLRGTVDVGRQAGDSVAWRLNAMGERGNSFRDGVELERFAINPTVTFMVNPQTALTLDLEHLDDRRTADRGFPSQNGRPFDADPSTFFGNTDQSTAESKVDALSAVLEHDFGEGLTLKNNLRYARYDKFYQNVYPGSAVNAAGTMRLSAYNNANLRTNVFNQTDLTKKLTTGSIEHTLLAGVELGHQNSDNVRNSGFFGPTASATNATVSSSAPYAVATGFRQAGTDANNVVRSDIAAAYVQDEIAFTPQWKVLAGVRYDHFKVDFDDRRTSNPPTDLSRTDNNFSPRLGLVWIPTAASTYYISYSYAFLPSGEQLGLATTTADLAPEKSINYEIGARWNLRPGLTLSTAVFRLNKQDVRVADPANPGFFVKTGEQRTDGIEIGLQGDVTRYWQVYGSYAHLDGKIVNPINSGTAATAGAIIPAGRRIGLVPENTFALWNKFELGAGWGTGLGVIYQGASYTSFNNTVQLPSFYRVDGALYYIFPGRKTRIALNVENLLDKEYFPTSDGDNNISPGAPINARVTLSMAF
jgi:catecholate siderophore receptor